MSRRILVTGSAGFLGRHLCRLIRERSDTPVGLDIATDPDAPFMQVVGSVIDPKSWRTVGAVDGVIHAAALTDLWRADPGDYDRINTGGSVAAARFARERGIRMVLVSSYTALIRAMLDGEHLLDGRDAPDPGELIGPYAQSKRRAEVEAAAVHDDVVTVRPTAPIGPGDHAPTPPMRLVREVAAGRLPGVMRGRINVVDIRDVADAVLEALLDPAARGAYLLGGEDLSLKDFAARVAREAGVTPPRLEVSPRIARFSARIDAIRTRFSGRPPAAPLDGVRLAAAPVRFDAARARAELGFACRPLDRSIADAVAFLRQDSPAAP